MRTTGVLILLLLVVAPARPANDPERVEWFRDLGLGLFIHWSLDSQVTSVISHSMVGADEGYLKRYVEELPRAFNPKRFDAREWARLARLAGFRYVVFTSKHHSGFCMFETKTTEFKITNTPYGRDVTKELFAAFRAEGLAIGHYFSPDDFHFLYKQGTLITRIRDDVLLPNNPELHDLAKAQMRELMENYAPVDIVFFDSNQNASIPQDEQVAELKEIVWEVNPKAIVTRGEIETPEQYTPGVPIEGAWEGNLTMGGQWQYRGTNEYYKSATTLINTWIETRAKGGNLLLNIGPKPDGDLPIEQEARMREMALWRLVNEEAVHGVRSWVITNEGDIWFTKANDADTVYAFVTNTDWPYGARKTFTLASVEATDETTVRVLGQNEEVLEYTDVIPKTEWEQTPDGLRVTAYRAQRLYNDRRWPNPVTLKITHAKAGLRPPEVISGAGTWDGNALRFAGELRSLGDAESVDVGFEYRRKKSTAEMYEADDAWKMAGKRLQRMSRTGAFSAAVPKLDARTSWEFRAVVEHPKVRMTGTTVEAASR